MQQNTKEAGLDNTYEPQFGQNTTKMIKNYLLCIGIDHYAHLPCLYLLVVIWSNIGVTSTPNIPPAIQVVTYEEATPSFQEPAMIPVTGGTFSMGCTSEQGSNCGSDEKNIRIITLSAYSIGKYEVTVGQYLAFCEETGGNWPEWLEEGSANNVETGKDMHYKDKGYKRNGAESLPIQGVSWNDAKAYCQWLSQKTGKNYHLPTEAEWEYAARGGNQSNSYKYGGSNTVGDVAWLSDNASSKPHTVGGRQANELGIYDMSGNVWEWCSDWYASDYDPKDLNNPKGPTKGVYRVYRGGSWSSYARGCRVSYRCNNTPTFRYFHLGFRIAL